MVKFSRKKRVFKKSWRSRGLEGKGTVECAYVAMLGGDKQVVGTDLDYFSTKVKFGKKGGVEEVYPIGPLNDHETARMKEVNAALSAEIAKGVRPCTAALRPHTSSAARRFEIAGMSLQIEMANFSS